MDSLVDIADYEKLNTIAKQLLSDPSSLCGAFAYVYLAEIQIKNAQTDSAQTDRKSVV